MESIKHRDCIHVLDIISIILTILLPILIDIPVSYAIQYLTIDEALKRVMPEADEFIKDKVTLSVDELKEVYKRLGKRFRNNRYIFYIGLKDKKRIGYGLILNIRGKERPITFMIAVDPDARIKGVEVLVYRESQGSEIRYKRFMRQFYGKDIGDPLAINRDINAITGATLSSRAAVYAVKKTLALFEVVYRDKRYK